MSKEVLGNKNCVESRVDDVDNRARGGVYTIEGVRKKTTLKSAAMSWILAEHSPAYGSPPV